MISPRPKAYDPDEAIVFFADNRPHMIATWGTQGLWAFQWHPDQHWVSFRRVTDEEVERVRRFALNEHDAWDFHRLHAEYELRGTHVKGSPP